MGNCPSSGFLAAVEFDTCKADCERSFGRGDLGGRFLEVEVEGRKRRSTRTHPCYIDVFDAVFFLVTTM